MAQAPQDESGERLEIVSQMQGGRIYIDGELFHSQDDGADPLNLDGAAYLGQDVILHLRLDATGQVLVDGAAVTQFLKSEGAV